MSGYAIILTGGARDAIREMEDSEKQLFAAALRVELLDDEGVPIQPFSVVPTVSTVEYLARPLTTGHVVVFRNAVEDELKTLALERREAPTRAGVVLHDVLSRPGHGRRRPPGLR